MPIDPKLLEILRCPVTKQPLSILTKEQIEKINQKISTGSVSYSDGSKVENELEEGLVTDNGSLIYRIDTDIPIMLQDHSIPMSELGLE